MKIIEFDSGSVFFDKHRVDDVPENLNSRHCHDKYEILYVIEGHGKYIVEGVEYPVKPRTLMIFPPLAFHCVSVDAGSVYERCLLHFDKQGVADCAQEAFSRISEISVPSGAFYSSDSISDSVASIFDRFENAVDMPARERESFSRLLMSELLILLSMAKREDLSINDGELGARVIRYLNDNAYRDISLDKLAKRFFVSKFYLCRAFKKHNGISIHGYIVQKRVMYAKQLIESGEAASSAAYKVGFGDYSAFYRAYVKVVGRAPTAQEERVENEV